MRSNYYTAAVLCSSAKEEVVAFIGLMPLLRSSWVAPWCPPLGRIGRLRVRLRRLRCLLGR
eukprot:13975007-Alexandrium_andersonii.AAC.1